MSSNLKNILIYKFFLTKITCFFRLNERSTSSEMEKTQLCKKLSDTETLIDEQAKELSRHKIEVGTLCAVFFFYFFFFEKYLVNFF